MIAPGSWGTITKALLKLARGTRGGLVAVTIMSCIMVNILCSDQYLAIILPGRMYKEAFEDLRLAPKNLSRCLEDSRYAYIKLRSLEYMWSNYEHFLAMSSMGTRRICSFCYS